MKKVAHQLTENVKLLQKAVLIHDGRCLILKRAADAKSRPGLWDLPGGNVEWPESKKSLKNGHVEEMLREVVEETGVIYNEDSAESCYVGSYFDAEQQIFTIILGWKIEVSQIPEVKISDEHTEYAWMKLEDGPNYDFGFAGESDGYIRKMIQSSIDTGCDCGGCGGACGSS